MPRRLPRLPARSRSRREPERLSRDPAFVASVAALLPGEDKGNPNVAEQVLRDLENRYPKAARLSHPELLSAIRKGRKADFVDLDIVVLHVRKLFYGYSGDPDWITEVLTPEGGKPYR